jgi:hypothetical protein
VSRLPALLFGLQLERPIKKITSAAEALPPDQALPLWQTVQVKRFDSDWQWTVTKLAIDLGRLSVDLDQHRHPFAAYESAVENLARTT